MYIPPYAQSNDTELILDVMKRYPFVTVITEGKNGVDAGHYPVLTEKKSDGIFISMHTAKANPQTQELIEQKKALIIFNGPYRYISPSYYKSSLQVPTWNYVAIHAQCQLESTFDDFASMENLLNDSVDFFEKENKTDWKYNVPQDFRQKLVKMITGFRFKVISMNAKFKMSQNRKNEDYFGVIEALKNDPDKSVQDLLLYMEKTTPDYK